MLGDFLSGLYMDDLAKFIVALGLIWVVCQCLGKSKEEGFDPYGYSEEDKEVYAQEEKRFKSKYPTQCNSFLLGYDNPYIYPYNHGSMNMLHPIDRYKYPMWVRQIGLEASKWKGYQGFGF